MLNLDAARERLKLHVVAIRERLLLADAQHLFVARERWRCDR